MGHIRDKFHVDAPIEAVWDLGADPQRLTEWQTNLVEVKDVTPGKLDYVGAAYRFVYRFAGRELTGRFEITKIEKPTYVEYTGTTPGGGTATFSTRAEPTGTGTDITFEMDYELPGGFFGDLADKLFMERQIERDSKHFNQNFKALCEAKVLTPA